MINTVSKEKQSEYKQGGSHIFSLYLLTMFGFLNHTTVYYCCQKKLYYDFQKIVTLKTSIKKT